MREILISVLFFPVACLAQDDSVSKMDQCRQLATAVANEGTGVYRAALCFESIHDLVDAANAYRRAGDLHLEPGTAIVRLASIFLLTGQYERALNEVQATIQALRAAGTSKIKPILHNCALLEDLTTQEETVSFMFYDSSAPGGFKKALLRTEKLDSNSLVNSRTGHAFLWHDFDVERAPRLQRSTLKKLSTNAHRGATLPKVHWRSRRYGKASL